MSSGPWKTCATRKCGMPGWRHRRICSAGAAAGRGHIILIDATDDGKPPGTVTRTTPRFSQDYPPTLTAHDIGVKDLLDAFYMQSGEREVVLYAISIDPKQPISMDLSPACAKAAGRGAARRIVRQS